MSEIGAPTADAELNHVLHELISRSRAILGSQFVGAYLHGSFALGSWDVHSDVDFLIVVAQPVTDAALAALQIMHQQLYALSSHWAQHLEGSYFPADWLRQGSAERQPIPFLDNGSLMLVPSEHDDTLVVRWMVRERGITLAGPDPRTLIDPLTPDALRREVWAKMQWWAGLVLADPTMLDNRWDQPYLVLSFCRMLETIQTGTVGSKPAAVAWAKRELGAAWADLVQRAWDERPFPSQKIRQPADRLELERTLAFIPYALSVGRRLMNEPDFSKSER